eukprot:4580593-Pyramimonas_sp.AAC.1
MSGISRHGTGRNEASSLSRLEPSMVFGRGRGRGREKGKRRGKGREREEEERDGQWGEGVVFSRMQ